nr:hypothetical protein CFP56_03853 [Quercus suber]
METQTQRPDHPASSAPTPPSSTGRSPRSDDVTPDEQPEHARQAEQREASEFWGYLFKQDKTGTDKLKSLLRGLKDVVNTEYDPSDSPDLTPAQLAHFYRDLHGNYDQLFLGTPHDSIAFIYKSLGCMHSLQPQAYTHSKAFTDPTVPALKTEGWIMWQTIQLLLGPDEHASFLREAVQRWDVKDPDTGNLFPKILPRDCFPSDPDKHMVAWYEGVSERLRREAEEEERTHETEAAHAETRRLHARQEDTDDEGSVDSKGPALAYFRNPLYRHVDGRPSIVARNSKRPSASPRPSSMKGKGKEAVGTFGHIVRNVASPNLWSGKGGGSGSDSRERDKDRDRRRRSLPEHNRYDHSDAPSAQNDDGSMAATTRQRRHPSNPTSERPDTASSINDGRHQADRNSMYSPHLSPRPTSQHRGSRESRDPSLRHSRSHDPTPSQKEYGDYFAGYENHQQHQISADPRHNSAYDNASPPTSSGAASANGSHGPSTFAPGGFGPSASPLFASHVARQPQPRMSASDVQSGNAGLPSRQPPSIRYSQDRDDPSPRPGNGDRRSHPHRYESPRRPRFEQSPAGYGDDDGPPRPPSSGRKSQRGSHDQPMPPPRRRSGRRSGSDYDYDGPPPPPSDHGRNRSRDDGRRGDDARRRSRAKQTRFAGDQSPPPQATQGVHGRKYVDESPWR